MDPSVSHGSFLPANHEQQVTTVAVNGEKVITLLWHGDLDSELDDTNGVPRNLVWGRGVQ
jgi:hypothetical protein